MDRHQTFTMGGGAAFPHRLNRGAIAPALAILLLALSHDLRAQTPAGTEIKAAIAVTYEGPDGQSFASISDTLVMVVAQVAGVDIEGARTTSVDPGELVTLPHTVRNAGNGPDSLTVTTASSDGVVLTVYLDDDSDGVLDPSDPALNGPLALRQDETVSILVVAAVPATPTVRGTTLSFDVIVTSRFDQAETDRVTHLLEVRDAGIVVSLSQTVDRTTATVGDLLTYTISYTATGSRPATDVEIANLIPIGATYVPATMEWNGNPVTDAVGDDLAHFDATANRVVFTLPELNGGDTGTVAFQVRVDG